MTYNAEYKNIYNPKSSEPYRISRSKFELFIQCPRCFYLDGRLGVRRPSMPPFTLNSAVDTLLKKEFDLKRSKGKIHPLMKAYGINAIPYNHKDLNIWRNNFKGLQTLHKPTNFIVFGAIDDIWQDDKGKLIIVDYKATSTIKEINLDDRWKQAYKRQIEIYQWIARQMGLNISNTGYFVYANGITDKTAFDAKLEFDLTIMPYVGDCKWVEQVIIKAYKTLNSRQIPEPNELCEYCNYIQVVNKSVKLSQGKIKQDKLFNF